MAAISPTSRDANADNGDMTDDTDWDARFNATVLGWVQAEKDAEAVEVIQVGGYGTDWEGDTEGGFYSSFYASVKWRRADGTERTIDVDGEDMGSMWDWVVKGKRPS